MPAFLIVPASLYDEIHRRLDELFIKFPDAQKDRDALYHQLLDVFNEYGHLPEFTLQKKVEE